MSRNDGFSGVKWLVVVVVIAALAGAGIWYWQHPGKKEADYKATPVTVGDLIQTVTATGQLNPVTNVQVGSQVSGIIRKLYADFNSTVTNGQLVAQLDPATYKAIAAQAAGDLANAKAALELAQAESDRANILYTNKIVAKADFDIAVATLHQAEAQVAIKSASLDQANVNLAYTSIFAPINGVVISRSVDVGQTVAASLSAPILFQIANDLAQMQIDALVSEADIGGISSNQPVNFSVDAFPSRIFHGVVTQIRNAPQTNQNVITYDTVINVENGDLKLRPGMTANVSIITAKSTGALRIRNGALRFRPVEVAEAEKAAGSNAPANPSPDPSGMGRGQRGGGGNGADGGQRRGGAGGDSRSGGSASGRLRGERSAHTVYVLAKDSAGKEVAQPVQIHTGIGDGIYTEVLDGLKEGDPVIEGQNLPVGAAAPAAPGNPFGGGGRRF
jgi:HlyD family secretion protein